MHSSREIKARFGVDTAAADGSSEEKKEAILAKTEIALCCARAGIQVLSLAQIGKSKSLQVVADVMPCAARRGRARPPCRRRSGQRHQCSGIGPLAVGNVKYQTEFGLFRKMIEAQKPVCFDFRDASRTCPHPCQMTGRRS